ncbi:MAG TPA: hypothetical protein VN605_15270 [Thermoanaerobaculia bacterium]|nr:hypothetical protein [Thermoanaerobaculia bacterium]
MSDSAVSPWAAYSRCIGLYVTGVIWLVTYTIVLLALKFLVLAPAVAAGVAFLPVVPFSFFLFAFIKTLRNADELQRRIQLEALAIAFPITLVGLMLLGLFEVAFPNGLAHDWSYHHIWTYLPLIYFCSVAVASHRYR